MLSNIKRWLPFHGSLFGGGPKISTPSKDAFYWDRPANFDTLHNGAILRSRPVDLVYFPGFQDPPLQAWQVAYKTKAQDGMTPQVTVTTIIRPSTARKDSDGAWHLLSYQSKCDSASPNCRTSYALRAGNDYKLGALSEQVFMEPCLDRGWIVLVPDYESETDAFGAGPQSAYATLDGIRAALAFADLGIADADGKVNAKVTLWGYSGGALATGWAAQKQPSYAPELPVVGASIGGVPADLNAIAVRVNKTIAAGLYIGVMAGLSNAYPELASWLDSNATPAGKKAFAAAKSTSFGVVMKDNINLDVVGTCFNASLVDPLGQKIPAQIIEENKVGLDGAAPTMPMQVYHSIHDEVVPVKTVDDLVDTWAKSGSTIEYVRDTLSEHVVLSFTGCAAAIDWIQTRFDGEPPLARPGKPRITTVFTSLESDDAKITLGAGRQSELNDLLETKYKQPNRKWWT
ncbi:related to lipase family [Pseudozyma flocculosa]|uniref:triacylglycerol lipase n=1 Tax=Pseudozyma flocculosa TaxID=84751 RepID=A0A5C3F4X7_9BASI|nr:related to lipase family [Pseudozyma flocculosa]